jgi:hypothetical protein
MVLNVATGAGLAPQVPAAPDVIRVEDALKHVGKRVAVCGTVVDTAYLEHLGGAPTFLNLDRPYPNLSFTIVIWGQNRHAFRSSPHEFYRGKKICVTGIVQTYKGRPQIEARDAGEITVTDPGLDADRFSAEERAVIRSLLISLRYCEGDHSGIWNADTDQALAAFRAGRDLEGDGNDWPRTLRALAEEAALLSAPESLSIVRTLLLNLAQRETASAGG